jgi:tRNA (guanine37-N1)-methyltransferase
MKCVKVEKKFAQKVKKELITKKVLSKTYRPVIGRSYVYFPIDKEIKGYIFVNKKCEEMVRDSTPVNSYDQIGDIAIVGEEIKKTVAKELLHKNNIKAVFRKKGIHHGEFRTQDLEWVAGEKRLQTTYKENGVFIKLNVMTSYFSARLGTERKRIADLVKDGEKVLVLFSGVAPYPLVIAKHANPKLIVAVEKNPIAHKFALANCKKKHNIALFNMDAKNFTYKDKFDRILMPLPKSSEDFLSVAKKLVKKGGIIHFYDFISEKDFPQDSIKKIENIFKNFKVLRSVKCGQYAPGKYRVCIDFRT